MSGEKKGWATALPVILDVGVPIVVDLIKAFVAGDQAAYRRVAKIIPVTLRTEAKLAHEQARLAALKYGDE